MEHVEKPLTAINPLTFREHASRDFMEFYCKFPLKLRGKGLIAERDFKHFTLVFQSASSEYLPDVDPNDVSGKFVS